MLEGEAGDAELRWELLPRGAFLAIDEAGLRYSLKRGGRGAVLVPFKDLTHVDVSERGLWLASKTNVVMMRLAHFPSPELPEEIVRRLRWALEATLGGTALLERMREVAARAQNPAPRRATTVMAALCVAVFVVQVLQPMTLEIGSFVPALVAAGEIWRIITANFVHGLSILPVHLTVNVLCLLSFGLLVERPLGATRTFAIMGLGGVGAMTASALAGYEEVIGASGVVAALAGAVLWLELNEGERLPGWWRLPRRMFITVLVLQAIADMILPFVAAAAHSGGFVIGYLAARRVGPGALGGEPPTLHTRVIAAVTAVLTVAALGTAGQLLLREGAALERHGRRMMTMQDPDPLRLNEVAWTIVTEGEPSPGQMELALELANRAVEITERANPDILDTLAEVLFVFGRPDLALQVIEEAIELNYSESYFQEQRRRFTGERAPDDRPAPPQLPWPLRKQLQERFLGPVRPDISI